MSVYLQPDRIYNVCGVTVKEFFLNNHNPNKISLPAKRKLPLAGITAHNTPAIKVSSKTTMAEQYVRATYNGNMGTVVVQFYADDVEAWACYPEEYQSWHAGSKGEPERNGSHIGNQATISIEIIGNSAKAEDNAARLIAYLLNKYDLDIDKLFTHNYWVNVRRGRKGSVDYLNKLDDGYKGCPIYIRPHWDKFKATVQKYLEQLAGNDKKELYRIQVGAFSKKENAEAYLKEVKKSFPNAFITKS